MQRIKNNIITGILPILGIYCLAFGLWDYLTKSSLAIIIFILIAVLFFYIEVIIINAYLGKRIFPEINFTEETKLRIIKRLKDLKIFFLLGGLTTLIIGLWNYIELSSRWSTGQIITNIHYMFSIFCIICISVGILALWYVFLLSSIRKTIDVNFSKAIFMIKIFNFPYFKNELSAFNNNSEKEI